MGWKLRLGRARDYIRHGNIRDLARTISTLVHSESIEVGCRKDLTHVPPLGDDRRQPLIRPASLADILAITGTEPGETTDADDEWQRRSRRAIVDSLGVEGCFVADMEGVGPVFMHYLFTTADNDRLQSAYPGMFPILADDEAMVEHLYVSPKARNSSLVFDCVAQVYDEARRRGVASVITFVGPTNTGAMYLSHSTGYRGYCVRRRRMRLFRKTYAFEPWPTAVSDSLLDLATGNSSIS